MDSILNDLNIERSKLSNELSSSINWLENFITTGPPTTATGASVSTKISLPPPPPQQVVTAHTPQQKITTISSSPLQNVTSFQIDEAKTNLSQSIHKLADTFQDLHAELEVQFGEDKVSLPPAGEREREGDGGQRWEGGMGGR